MIHLHSSQEKFEMLNVLSLREEQIQPLHDDGFLVLPGAFSVEEKAAMSSWSDEMLARLEKTGALRIYHE